MASNTTGLREETASELAQEYASLAGLDWQLQRRLRGELRTLLPAGTAAIAEAEPASPQIVLVTDDGDLYTVVAHKRPVPQPPGGTDVDETLVVTCTRRPLDVRTTTLTVTDELEPRDRDLVRRRTWALHLGDVSTPLRFSAEEPVAHRPVRDREFEASDVNSQTTSKAESIGIAIARLLNWTVIDADAGRGDLPASRTL